MDSETSMAPPVRPTLRTFTPLTLITGLLNARSARRLHAGIASRIRNARERRFITGKYRRSIERRDAGDGHRIFRAGLSAPAVVGTIDIGERVLWVDLHFRDFGRRRHTQRRATLAT